MNGPIGIVGKSGQVAKALVRLANSRGEKVAARGRPELDLTNAASIETFLNDATPSVVVNAAAFTAVDKAETERDEAFAVNAIGAGALAAACAARDVPLIQVSTDYVFDGSNTKPYLETDLRRPSGVYGASKAAGEVAVAAAAVRHIILRTAWVYSLDGANFVHTMLRLGEAKDQVGVVADQIGTPTFADDIAGAVLDIIPKLTGLSPDADTWGIYHLTGGGETTWHGFAAEIFRLAGEAGLKTPKLNAITTAQYPTPARRPAYSVLSNKKIGAVFGITSEPWQETLARAFPKILAVHEAGHSK